MIRSVFFQFLNFLFNFTEISINVDLDSNVFSLANGGTRICLSKMGEVGEKFIW